MLPQYLSGQLVNVFHAESGRDCIRFPSEAPARAAPRTALARDDASRRQRSDLLRSPLRLPIRLGKARQLPRAVAVGAHHKQISLAAVAQGVEDDVLAVRGIVRRGVVAAVRELRDRAVGQIQAIDLPRCCRARRTAADPAGQVTTRCFRQCQGAPCETWTGGASRCCDIKEKDFVGIGGSDRHAEREPRSVWRPGQRQRSGHWRSRSAAGPRRRFPSPRCADGCIAHSVEEGDLLGRRATGWD